MQLEAVKIKYDALRYINNPALSAELLSIKSNEAAIKLIKDLNKDKILEFLKANILVIKYITKSLENEISPDDVKEVLKETLSKEDIEEKYVRDFLNCSIIDRNSDVIVLDKIMFIYKYGSKKSKQIAVDEKLKFMN